MPSDVYISGSFFFLPPARPLLLLYRGRSPFAAVRLEAKRDHLWGHSSSADGSGDRLHRVHASVSVQASPWESRVSNCK